MGVGKTTLGRALAVAIRWPFIDTDEEIERRYGHTGADIARSDGVTALHAIELEVFEDSIAVPIPSVVASAESIVDSAAGRSLLGSVRTVWLDAPVDDLETRRRQGGHRRAISPEDAAELRARRRRHLLEVAIGRVDTSMSLDGCVASVRELLDDSW